MKKIVVLLMGSLLLFPGCLGDPDPIPDTIEARLIFYNNLMEPDKVVWEVDNSETLSGQSYGLPAEGVAKLEDFSQLVHIKVSTLEGGIALDSFDYHLDPFRYYMISILGTEEEPYLLCDTIDTGFPTIGLMKMRFLQAAENMGTIDIYVGGGTPEHRILSEIEYSQLSDYVEASQESFWNAIIITPTGILPGDSTILSYTVNNSFIPNNTYLGIINHTEIDPESSFRMQVFNQPVY
jgi:hypothetical protein